MFQELEPVDPWDYLLDATEDSPACPQKELIYGRMTLQPRGQSEDCIYLNLHVPYSHFPTDKVNFCFVSIHFLPKPRTKF